MHNVIRGARQYSRSTSILDFRKYICFSTIIFLVIDLFISLHNVANE